MHHPLSSPRTQRRPKWEWERGCQILLKKVRDWTHREKNYAIKSTTCQENQGRGRKLPVPVLVTEEKAVSLGEDTGAGFNICFSCWSTRFSTEHLRQLLLSKLLFRPGAGLGFNRYTWHGKILALLQGSPVFFLYLTSQQSSAACP